MTDRPGAAGEIPDFGLTVELTEDEHGHPLYVVRDKTGVCESSPSLDALSPMARITWAAQSGLPLDRVVKAGQADGMLYRGIDLSDG
jgi:hypothetical protein